MPSSAKPLAAGAGVIARMAAAQFGRPAAGIRAKRVFRAAPAAPTPQGFTDRQFRRFAHGARRLQREAGLPKGDLVVHGSRVRGTAHPRSDIDVALRVDDRTFFELAEKALARTHPGTRLRSTMMKRINGNGQLSSFDLGPDFTRRRLDLLDPHSPHEVQFSVLRIGGRLDTGPFRPLV